MEQHPHPRTFASAPVQPVPPKPRF